MSDDYQLDPERVRLHTEGEYRSTGYFIRAKDGEGRWGSHDIIGLDRASLLSWLRSRGGDNPWAESLVLGLLGHPT